jgi:uncharacterized YccA/Bax inhibitor family protein
MTVTPVPIVLLLPVVLSVVITIFSSLLREVTSVGVVFAIVPVVIVTVVPIVDSDLHAFLRRGARQSYGWHSKSRSQDQ